MSEAVLDPLEAAAARIALFVGASQPFYPLTMWWVGGWSAAVAAALVLVVTPLFLLVPLVTRRRSGAGRMMLVIAGTLVTILAAQSLGRSSWVEAYYLSVVLVGLTLFRRPESGLRLAALSLPLGCLAVLHSGLPPSGWLEAATSVALGPVHLFGSAGLSLYVLWQARTAWRG